MIRNSLNTTKLATFSVDLPSLDQKMRGIPIPTGTGFFVSPDGWFITAAHVITTNGQPDGPPRNDINKSFLIIEAPPDDPQSGSVVCQAVKFDYIDPETDFALLKVDFQANTNKDHWKDKTSFPYLEVSVRQLDEGEPVYSFGYPLPNVDMLINTPEMMAGHFTRSPRVTSAIIASSFEKTEFLRSVNKPKVYVLDKALNYGNSGGPIIATETGKVHAFCSRFQPISIIQEHLHDKTEKTVNRNSKLIWNRL